MKLPAVVQPPTMDPGRTGHVQAWPDASPLYIRDAPLVREPGEQELKGLRQGLPMPDRRAVVLDVARVVFVGEERDLPGVVVGFDLGSFGRLVVHAPGPGDARLALQSWFRFPRAAARD